LGTGGKASFSILAITLFINLQVRTQHSFFTSNT
jgi:hypothetical protein